MIHGKEISVYVPTQYHDGKPNDELLEKLLVVFGYEEEYYSDIDFISINIPEVPI